MLLTQSPVLRVLHQQKGVRLPPILECLYRRSMTKKYQIVREKIPKAGGGFIEAFKMALIEFTCLGETRYDVSGYPHETVSEALVSDWATLTQDFRQATKKIESENVKEAGKFSDDTGRQAVSHGTAY